MHRLGTLRDSRSMSLMWKSISPFLRGCQKMQHGIGRAAHRDVQRHGILECGLVGDVSWQRAGIIRPRSSAAPIRRWCARPCGTAARGLTCVATSEPLPGRDRPNASVRQFIELAVNMPEHEPQVGHAERSIVCTSASDMLSFAAATMASMRSSATSLPASRVLPASIGPPETNTTGMFRRRAAISMPGVILSQFEIHTSASAVCALHMYSTLSAMMSRDGRL